MLRTEINKRLFYYLSLALAFAIPVLDRLVVFIIIALVLNWLAEGRFKQRFSLLVREKKSLYLLSFSVLYFIYCLGLIYSQNLSYAWFDIQVKLSLLIFPLIFATADTDVFDGKKIFELFQAFILGCILISVFMLVHAFLNYTQTNSRLEFYYVHLSAFQHPSYFSMNLNFAVVLIIITLVRQWNSMLLRTRVLLIFLIPYFFLFIFLLSSKAGILCLFFILFVSLFSLMIYKKEYIIFTLFLFMLPFSFVGAYYLFPDTFYRMAVAKDILYGKVPIDLKSDDGTNERILIWKSSLEIVKENPALGVGTGDVKDALLQKYEENHITAAITKRLNAHNQYLQTCIALGLIGLLVLLLCLLLPAISAIKNHDLLYFLFLMLVFLNLLFESMLERQAGVVFYSFFNALLFVKQEFNKA
ncbi:MAG: O-antigen ligase family protein [Bacteroidales bacterium]